MAGSVYIGADTNRGVLIRIKNAGDLARSQGHLASLAQALAPSMIEAKVYDELAKQLKSSLKDKNVDADVTVVEPGAFATADGKHIARDIGIGLLAAGGVITVGALLWRLVGRKNND